MKKKVLSVVLAVVIACSVCLVMTSAAETEFDVTSYSIEEIDSNYNLYAIGATKPEYVVAEFNEECTKVVISKNGEDSDGAISNDYRFLYTSLEEVVIGNGVKNYDATTFWGCDSIKNFNVSSDNEYYTVVDGVLFSKDMTELVHYPIGKDAISYTIPESVSVIKTCAFAGSSLEEVVFPSSLNTIEEMAFSDCAALSDVVLPEGLVTLGVMAFDGCTSLTTLTVPSTLNVVDMWAFGNCTALSDIILAEGCTVISGDVICDTAFYNDESNWENDVLYLGNCLIAADEDISGSCIVKEGITSIADYAFAMCFNLTSVEISVGVTSIGDYVFAGCVSLEDVVFPEGVTSINAYAFQYCEEFTSVTIPNSVVFIDETAFADCGNLVVCGHEGSYAEVWANENEFSFVALSDESVVGDINGDGKVSAVDARLVLQYVVGSTVFDENQMALADVNEDGKISAVDARCILRVVAGLK